MERKQRFSLRKYKVGLASVLIGTIFLGGALMTGVVHADDVIPGAEATSVNAANPVADSEPVAATAESVLPTNGETSATEDSEGETPEEATSPTQPEATETTATSTDFPTLNARTASASEGMPEASTRSKDEVTSEADVTPAASNDVPEAAAEAATTPIRHSEVNQPTGNNIMVGLEGTFETPDKEAILNRLNAIRKEAFDEGLTNSYVPLQWSNDLEEATMTRAAEASVTRGHLRLSDKEIWSASPDDLGKGENLAWNHQPVGKGILAGIEQWYEEKADYIIKHSGGKPEGQTGHYENMINPEFTYTALSNFHSNYLYPSSVTQWFTTVAPSNSTKTPKYGPTIQLTESKSDDFIEVTLLNPSEVLVVNSSKPVQMEGTYRTPNKDLASWEKSDSKFAIVEGFDWTSTNPTVATVVRGNIIAANAGKTTLSTTINGKSYAIDVTVVDTKKDDLSALKTVETVTVPYTTMKSGDDHIDRNVRQTVVKGVDGSKRVTTSYVVNAQGQVEKQVSEEVVTAPVTEEIHVGTRPETTYSEQREYIADETIDFGKVEGSNRRIIGFFTQRYYYNSWTDTVEKSGTNQGRDYFDMTVRVGVKPTTSGETIPFKTTYVADDQLEVGQTREVKKGEDGIRGTRTTYKLSQDHAVVDEVISIDTPATDAVIAIGTKAARTSEVIPFTRSYVADNTLDANQTMVRTAGVAGSRTLVTTYEVVDGKAVAKETKTEVADPTTEVIAVGTKPTITTTDVDFDTTYEADDTLDYNTTAVRTPGVKGQSTTTTTYKLDGNQAVVDNTTTTQTTAPTNEVIAVGTKPTTTTADVDYDTTYVADDTLAYGQIAVRTPGVKGQSTTTTTYKLDGNQAVVDNTSTTQTTAPTNKAIAVGTKPTTTTADVDFDTTYVADATLAYGKTVVRTQGVKGVNTTTTTYKLDGNKAVVDNITTAQTTDPTVEIIAVGTKPTTTTADVDFETTYAADDTLAYGKTVVRTPGVKGQATTTTTYKLDGNKAVVDKTSTAQTTDPTVEVIAVGTKATTTTADVDYTTSYVADATLAYGQTAVRTQGVKGQSTITTTYKLDGNKAVVDTTTTTQTTAPTNEVIAVGTKPTTTTADVDYTTTYVADDTLDYGKTSVRTPGVKGQSTTTTTYKLDGEKAVVDTTTTTQTTPPTAEVMAVGNVQTSSQPIAIVTRNVNDDTLEAGQTRVVEEGKAGVLTTVTTYTVNPTIGTLENGQTQTTETVKMVERVVAVGTKVAPTETTRRVEVRTEILPFSTEHRENPALDKGVEREVQAGVNGSYKVVRDDVYQGDTLVKTGTEFETDRIAPVNRIIEVGTKETEVPAQTTRRVEVRIEVLPFTTQRRENAALNKGVEREVQAGVNGSYKIVRDDIYQGDALVKTGTEFATDRIAPVTRIIEVGTKEVPAQMTHRVEIRTETIPFTTERRENAALDKGVEREIQAGVNGSYKVVRDDVYEGNTLVKTGTEFATDRIAPVTRIIEVGTKEVPAQMTHRVEIRTETIPFTTERCANAALDKGVEREVQAGVNGSYKIVRDDVYEGDTLVKTGTEFETDRIEPVTRIIEVGTKETEVPAPTTRRVEVRTETIPFTTERRANAALDKGVEREIQAGVNGSYKVVRDDVYEGDTLVKTGTEFATDRIEPVIRIIEVGTKETEVPAPTTRRVEVRTETIPFTTERRANATLDKGVEREVQAGVNGSYKVVRDDVYEGDTLVKTGTEYTIDRIEPVIRIIEVGTKEVQTPTNPTNPVVTDVRPATPEEIKQLEDLKEQLKNEISQSNLPQAEKDRFLSLIDQAVAKDQLMTQVHNRQVTVSLDNSQVQAARLVVRELQGAEAREVATTVEGQLENQTLVTSYDIYLVDQNNQVVTNNGESRAVTIAIAKSDDETLSVYYVNGDQLKEMPSIYQNGQLTFFTDHFSVYSIVRTAQTKGDTNPTPTSVDVADPGSEKTARPVPAQASRPTQATLPNTGENEREAGQLATLGVGLLSLLGLAWVKRQKKDQA